MGQRGQSHAGIMGRVWNAVRREFTADHLFMYTLCAAAALFVIVFIPPPQSGREAKRKTECRSNLKQIGQALESYHEDFGCFPPAIVADEDGTPMHSWRVLILPYLDEHELFAKYRFNEPWNSPHNAGLAAQIPDVYQCPSFSRSSRHDTGRVTPYVAVTGERCVFNGTGTRCKVEILDKMKSTLFVAEVSEAAVPWTQPLDASPDEILHDAGTVTEHQHSGGYHVLLGEQSVRFLLNEISSDEFHRLCTIDDGIDPGEF